METLILIGRVTSVFGIKGWLNVYSYADPVENILDFDSWLLLPNTSIAKQQASLATASECIRVKVAEGQRHGKKMIARIVGCESREQAGLYVHHDIYVRRSDLPILDDAFYWIDLEGLQVFDTQGHLLGHVERMMATGANDVLVVRTDKLTRNGKALEILIPYVEGRYIQKVDVSAGCIVVDWSLDYLADD